MKKFLKIISVSILLLALFSWGMFKLPYTQNIVRERIESELNTKLKGYTVQIGSIDVVFPFFLRIKSISLFEEINATPRPNQNKIVSLEGLTLVPSWTDCIRGRISLLRVSMRRVWLDLPAYMHHQLPKKTKNHQENFDIHTIFNKLPKIPIHISSFSSRQILFSPSLHAAVFGEKIFQEPFNCKISSDFDWDPTSKISYINLKLHTAMKGSPVQSFSINSMISEEKTVLSATSQSVAYQTNALSTLGSDRCSLHFNADINNEKFFQFLKNPFHSTHSIDEIMHGSLYAFFEPNQHARTVCPDIYGFSANINYTCLSNSDIPFTIDSLHTHLFSAQKEEIDNETASSPLRAYFQNESTEEVQFSNQTEMPFPFPLQGSLKGRLHFTKQNPLKFTFEMASDLIQVSKLNIQKISLKSLGEVLPTNQGYFSFECIVSKENKPALPVSLRFRWDYAQSLILRDIIASMDEQKFDGQLELLPSMHIVGKISQKEIDLSRLSYFLPENMKGTAEFACVFSEEESKQKATLEISAKNLQYPAFHFAKTKFKAALLDKSLTIDAFFSKGHMLTMLCDSVTMHTEIPAIDLPEIHAPFSFFVSGKDKFGKSDVVLEGISTVTSNGIRLDCKDVILKTDHAVLTNKNPLMCSYTHNQLTIHPFQLCINDREVLTAMAATDYNTITGRLSLEQFPIEILDCYMGQVHMQGLFSGQMNLDGPLVSPTFDAELVSQKLRLWSAEFQHLEPLSCFVKCSYADKKFTSKGQLFGSLCKVPGEWQFNSDVHFSLAPFELQFKKESPLDGKFFGTLEVGPLVSHLLEETESIEGEIGLDIVLSGTSEKPCFSGEIKIENGTIDLFDLGARIQNIHAHAQVQDQEIIFDQISGTDGALGLVTATGHLKISKELLFPYIIECHLDEFRAINQETQNIIVSGALNFEGNIEKAQLDGAMTLSQADIQLSTNFAGSIPKIDIQYTNREENYIIKNKQPFVFNLNLNVEIPHHLRISGFGLQSEWKGKLLITNSLSAPRIFGQVNSIKGTLAFADKRLTIAQGYIDFAGHPTQQSQMNIITDIQTRDITAHIIVRGPLSSPRLDFQSNPPLEKKDIISWILFNKGSQAISPAEGIQLAQTMLSINNGTSNFDIIGKIKNTIGIDRIDLGTSTIGPRNTSQNYFDLQQTKPLGSEQPNAVSIRIGKYISDGVIVSLSKDMTNETSRIGIEMQLSGGLACEANIGDNSDAQLMIKWKKDY